MKPKILAIDGADTRKGMVEPCLMKAGFDVVSAANGDEALLILDQQSDISVVVTDRVLSKTPFMTILKNIKTDKKHKHIPVVVQTTSPKEYHIMECIEAGVQYYVVQPCADEMLVSVVRTAHKDAINFQRLREESSKRKNVPRLIKKAMFTFTSLQEANSLGFFLGHMFCDPDEATRSLITYLSNAVYANLGIYAQDRAEYLRDGRLDKEIERRQKNDLFVGRVVRVFVDKSCDRIEVRIIDDGVGFDWQKSTKLLSQFNANTLGRGSQTGSTYFDDIHYVGRGNEIVCLKKI